MTVRYTVTAMIPSTAAGLNPTLLVPFEPSALVSVFLDELFKRVQKRGVEVDSSTHVVSLHLDSQTGPIIDSDDVLSDVVDTDDKLFAVFKPKHAAPTGAATINNGQLLQADGSDFWVCVITPELAKQDRSTIQPIKIPKSSTIRQLHESVADHLDLPHTFDKPELDTECNCTLAKQLVNGANSATQFFVVHGKSNVQHLNLPSASTEAALYEVLKSTFGDDVANAKKISLYGAEQHVPAAEDDELRPTYKKPPVVSICSKQRHIPHHAKVQSDEDDSEQIRRVLDLHTSEVPISHACLDLKMDKIGMDALVVDGVLEIFAVARAANTASIATTFGAGKSSIFAYRAHWEPKTKQSDRGIAMFLSSLRVFASVVQEKDEEPRSKDAVYHVFDLLTRFAPALRTMHLLVEGKTPTFVEAAALSHAMFEVLDSFMPVQIVGNDHTRVFEGSRLLFGFILEKARSVKLAEGVMEDDMLPYRSSFRNVDLRDAKTTEPVFHPIHTSAGMMEKALFEAFEDQGVLAASPLRIALLKADDMPAISRVALLSGGALADVAVFSLTHLTENYTYEDAGNASAVFDLTELSELHHVAELCGRNSLSVSKPSQLVSAIAPSLAFDRNGHVAVYTGQLPCSEPGKSSGIFRPQHGEETVDEAVLEQLIAPILLTYESDGSAVFDLLGGSAVRRLQSPDEILVFAVDVSASMRQATDFPEVNEQDNSRPVSREPTAESVIDPELFRRVNLDDMKERLASYECFDDMTAIVAEAAGYRRRLVANEVLELLRVNLSSEILKKHKRLEEMSEGGWGFFGTRGSTASLQADMDSQGAFLAGLRTHEQSLCDFLIFAATNTPDVSRVWMWSPGDEIPSGTPRYVLPSLPPAITEVPNGFVCPVSHALMEEAVKAADDVTYSRGAIEQWFTIRKSSPMHNVPLRHTRLVPDNEVSAAVAEWISGDDLLQSGRGNITLKFVSRVGGFERKIPQSLTVNELYELVFRALKARFMVFQLTLDDVVMRPSAESVAAVGFKDGSEVAVRLADDANMTVSSTGASSTVSAEMVLIKVYDRRHNLTCSYWVKRDTPKTLASILWKYWRAKMANDRIPAIHEGQVWMNLKDSGDGLLTGEPMSSNDLNLAHYLNRNYCFGHLQTEPIHREESSSGTQRSGPLVLKVQVDRVYRSTRQNPVLSRLDVLKQMFEALINRMLAYSFKTHVGLVTFAKTASIAAPITHVLENLRRSTTNMKADGDTALWDALALAKDQLETYATKYPEAKKRIIVISDGADTSSSINSSQEIAWSMRHLGIAVDSICLGDEDQRELQTLSYLLGCYRFQPKSLVSALAVCELEPFLSTTERPAIVPPPGTPRNRLQFMGHFWRSRHRVTPTVFTEDRFPPRKEHPNMRDGMIQLSAAAALSKKPPKNNGSGRSNMRMTRLMQEMRKIVTMGGHPKADVYVSESDISFWKVVLAGPDESPYSAGCFMLYLHMGDSFPTFAPEARFVTQIKHPNVNAHGRICHALFSRDWTSDVSLSACIDTIFGLLLQAETSDPVNTTATLEFHHDAVEYADEVREFVRKHAKKTRQQWKEELVSGDA